MGRLISRRGLTQERGLGCPPLVCREMPLNVPRRIRSLDSLLTVSTRGGLSGGRRLALAAGAG